MPGITYVLFVVGARGSTYSASKVSWTLVTSVVFIFNFRRPSGSFILDCFCVNCSDSILLRDEGALSSYKASVYSCSMLTSLFAVRTRCVYADFTSKLSWFYRSLQS